MGNGSWQKEKKQAVQREGSEKGDCEWDLCISLFFFASFFIIANCKPPIANFFMGSVYFSLFSSLPSQLPNCHSQFLPRYKLILFLSQ